MRVCVYGPARAPSSPSAPTRIAHALLREARSRHPTNALRLRVHDSSPDCDGSVTEQATRSGVLFIDFENVFFAPFEQHPSEPHQLPRHASRAQPNEGLGQRTVIARFTSTKVIRRTLHAWRKGSCRRESSDDPGETNPVIATKWSSPEDSELYCDLQRHDVAQEIRLEARDSRAAIYRFVDRTRRDRAITSLHRRGADARWLR